MNKFKLSELSQLTYKIVELLSEDFVDCLKELIIDNRNCLVLRSKIFREAKLDYREYTPFHKHIIERMVLNVLLKKHGGKQLPLSALYKSMIECDEQTESKTKHDDSKLDSLFDMPTNMPTMESLASSGLSPTGRKRSAIEKQIDYARAYGVSPRQLGKSLQETFRVDMNTAEQLMKESSEQFSSNSLGLCSEIFTENKPKPCFLGFPTREKPMNLKVTHPGLVGTTNILTAQTFELEAIIREAQAQIKANEDLQELSQHHKNMKAELEEVIKLCVEQLDKGIKKDDTDGTGIG